VTMSEKQNRAMHIVGQALGAGLVLVPNVAEVLPTGTAKTGATILGVILLAVSNIFKALGR
jgi:hypothetical protein